MEANDDKDGDHRDDHRGDDGGGGGSRLRRGRVRRRNSGNRQEGGGGGSGDDTDCPFSRLCLHPRLASALMSPALPFKLERLTAIQSRHIAALLP